MSFRLLVAFCSLFCGSVALSQEVDLNELPRPEFRGLTQKQLSRFIFSNEESMIRRLRSLRPVTETYVQSLGHHQRQGLDNALDEEFDFVMDDLYLLARVDFGENGPEEKLLIGAGSWRDWRNRYIEINNGTLEKIQPLGMLWMFFVDFDSFDADTYSLTYRGKQTLLHTECLVFSVTPVKERDSGRFRGEIWVDSSSFNIVRAKGVFAGPYERWFKALKGEERYFHFDTWRERNEEGWWQPSATYFDERKAHPGRNLEFHYRGYGLFWQQPENPACARDAVRGAQPNSSAVANSSGSSFTKSLVARLEADGLLAIPAEQERRLSGIVRQIAPASIIAGHRIECRVLLTTPVEIFSVGDTIFVSRGLLNLIPNDSVLAFLLGRQVAHIVLGHTVKVPQTFPVSLFDLEEKRGFEGLGIHLQPAEEAEADSKAIALLKESPYKDTVAETRSFLSELKSESRRFPNLVRARFGTGIFPEGSSFAGQKVAGTTPRKELQFANRYGVSWNCLIVDRQRDDTTAEVRTVDEPRVIQAPVVK